MNVNSQSVKDKLAFSISLGGFDIETFESIPINDSLQVRRIAIGATVNIPLLTVQPNFIFRLSRLALKHYSAQGKQDLKKNLIMGNRKISISGKSEPPSLTPPFGQNDYVIEARVNATPGIPLSSISSGGGSGYPDNYAGMVRNYGIAFELEEVYLEVVNQSAVYPHGLGIAIYGWTFPAQGRSKCEIFGQLVR